MLLIFLWMCLSNEIPNIACPSLQTARATFIYNSLLVYLRDQLFFLSVRMLSLLSFRTRKPTGSYLGPVTIDWLSNISFCLDLLARTNLFPEDGGSMCLRIVQLGLKTSTTKRQDEWRLDWSSLTPIAMSQVTQWISVKFCVHFYVQSRIQYLFLVRLDRALNYFMLNSDPTLQGFSRRTYQKNTDPVRCAGLTEISDFNLKYFQARSQNCKKRPLASSCPSVCPHSATGLPLDGF